MAARRPDGPPPPPVVQRLRIRYAKRGRLRFTSHRDVARAVERALGRGKVPVAFSAGFSPHPKVSWMGAAPTGVASEAEYVEIGLQRACDPAAVREALDAGLPRGLDVLEVVEAAPGEGGLAERLEASAWRIELPGLSEAAAHAAVAAFVAAEQVVVERRTKGGMRDVDVRFAVLDMTVMGDAGDRLHPISPGTTGPYAIIEAVVQHTTPAVRPDDVLTALRQVAALELSEPHRATRLAQGRLTGRSGIVDPLEVDRSAATIPAAAGPPEDRRPQVPPSRDTEGVTRLPASAGRP